MQCLCLISKSTGKSTAATATPTTASPAPAIKGKQVDVLDKSGSEAPAALNLPVGNLYFGYKYVPRKTDEDKIREAEEQANKEPVFEGSGQTLRPPRKNATARGSGANSPSPSVSSATSISRAPTPAAQAPSSEPKPDIVPFQGKGNTMRWAYSVVSGKCDMS